MFLINIHMICLHAYILFHLVLFTENFCMVLQDSKKFVKPPYDEFTWQGGRSWVYVQPPSELHDIIFCFSKFEHNCYAVERCNCVLVDSSGCFLFSLAWPLAWICKATWKAGFSLAWFLLVVCFLCSLSVCVCVCVRV